MSVINTLRIGQAGIKASSYGIEVTAQNVTNASTEGYVRRRVVQEPRTPTRGNRGVFQGSGVSVISVNRSIDRNVVARTLEAMGDEAQARTAHESLQILESSFREGDLAGLSDRLDAFFDSLSELSLEPSDEGLRKAALDAGEDFTDSVNRAAGAASETITRIESRLEDEIENINETLQSIQVLNKQISDSDAVTGPGDLLDKRDALLEGVAQKLGVDVEYKSNGQVNLYVGGHAIVQDVHIRELSLSGSAGSIDVMVSVDASEVTVTGVLGGEFGGLFEARQGAETTVNDLNTFAEDFADAFNAQHALGYDRTSASGGDFFSFGSDPAISLALDSSLAADSDLLAAAGSPSAEVGDGSNLTELMDIEEDKLFGGGTQTSRDFISSIYSDLGSEVRGHAIDAETFSMTRSDLSSLKEAFSSVDLDEEAVSLIRYQASYEAAARVVSIADDLLGVLMRM